MEDIENAIRSFDNDPADTRFQEGYLAGMQEAKLMGQHIIAQSKIETGIMEKLKMEHPNLYLRIATEVQDELTRPCA